MLNSIDIIGRLTKEPEIRYTQNQKAVATFSIACDRDFKDSNGNKETDFFNCVVWGNAAGYVEKYVHKGDMVGISGRLQRRTWKDKQDNNRETIEINVSNIYGIGGKRDSSETTATAATTFTEVEDEGELPF